MRPHFKRTFCENQMLAKIDVVIPIGKQITSALENRFLFVDRTSQTRDIEENIWANFNFDSLSYLSIVSGEQTLHIFFIAPRWSFVLLDGFVVRRCLN